MPVRLPSLDIHTVGAGGGSLARIDAGGALRVGPQSAGADPGPACYGRGTLPTVTDANLVLGRLQAQAFLGGRMQLDIERARAALQPIAATLGGEAARALERAALGVVRVANAAMERAIRAISIERGDDPRGFTLVAFGGAGPLHAAHLAELLGMRRVLVPRYPGVLSALGMLVADVTRDAARTLLTPLESLDPQELHAWMRELADAGLAALIADGEARETCRVEFALDLRYAGQSHELLTPLTADAEYTPEPLAHVAERFHTLHARRYGHAMPGRPVEAVVLRVKAISARTELPLHSLEMRPRTEAIPHTLVPAVTANETGAPIPTALYQREDLLPGDAIAGPAIVAQLDATTVIPPGWRASVDGYLNLVLTVV
jgi:N-methylhydantoinase A